MICHHQHAERVRIHFTTQDVLKVRGRPSLGPLAETLHSLVALGNGHSRAAMGQWPARALVAMGGARRCLLTVARLDLVSIAGPHPTMAESVAAVLSAPTDVVQRELDFYGHAPVELRGLAEDIGVRSALMERLSGYHARAVAPAWETIRAHLQSEWAARSRTTLERGVDGLLTSLHPDIRWDAMTLRVPGADRDIHLDGRGLTLTPSVFLRRPAVMVDGTGAATVIYPAQLSYEELTSALTLDAPPKDLTNLVGRTRAMLLGAIGDGISSTGELAGRVGTSAAAVSQQTKVLREAGLILTRRDGPAVRHTLTRRGHLLLDGPV